MTKAKKIMKYSNLALFTRLIPSIGNELSRSGSIAQWIAQATVVTIPAASQLILPIAQIYR
jgi:hypothetical protein